MPRERALTVSFAYVVAPFAASSTSQITRPADTRAAGRSSPALTRWSASRLPSPATVNTARRDWARAGKVNVRRGCG